MSMGVFESLAGSESEAALVRREAADKLAAAVYDVRERFAPFLFQASSMADYKNRLALVKNDVLKTIAPHVFPRTGTVRRVLRPLAEEFRAKLAADTTDMEFNVPGLGPTTEGTGQQSMHSPAVSAPQKGAKVACSCAQLPAHEHCDSCRHEHSLNHEAARIAAKWGFTHEAAGGQPLPPSGPGAPADMVPGGVTNNVPTGGQQGVSDQISGAHNASRTADKTGPAMHIDVTYKPSSGELKPTADFDGWLNSVDQGTPEKVKAIFEHNPDAHEHTGNPQDVDFVKDARMIAAKWGFRTAADPIQWEKVNNDGYPAGSSGGNMTPEERAKYNDEQDRIHGLGHGSTNEYLERSRHGRQAAAKWCEQCGEMVNDMPAHRHQLGDDFSEHTHQHGDRLCDNPSCAPKRRESRRRTAAPDYLSKAADDLTNLLNQRAEDFQNTVAPLQQALQVIQQEQAAQQAANPLNVLPPAGTVNVLPQPPQGAAAGAPGLPGAGGDPSLSAPDDGGQGAPPPAATDQGLPPDPSQDPSQLTARKRAAGGRAKKGSARR